MGLLRDIDAERGDSSESDHPSELVERVRGLRGRRVAVRWFDGDDVRSDLGMVALVVPDGLLLIADDGSDGAIVHIGYEALLDVEEQR